MVVNYQDQIENFINSNNFSRHTIRMYRSELVAFLEFLDKKPLTRTNVANYLKRLRGKDRKNRTIKHHLTSIRCFSKWLWEEDILSEKEYKKIRGYNIRLDPGDDNRRALTIEEEKHGYQVLRNPLLRMLFWTGLHYGLRISEYINLTLQDLDLDQRVLTIRHSKGNKTRRIKILKTHIPIWEEWLKTREAYQVDHDYIFFTDTGKAATRTLSYYFNKISQMIINPKNGKITSHSLRYTFAVKCWRGGMDLFVLSKILGHASLQTTQTYLRVTEEEVLEKYEEQASKIL
ncbi:MAG: tyrosine-type recombinase/integrase [Candidatus Hermodarchaeota archaeon]